MLADRIQQLLGKLRLRPGMRAAQLLDEIEASAPEATLEEIAALLRIWSETRAQELWHPRGR